MTARGDRRAGFTLLELLLVMVVLGVVLGMGVGAFASLKVPGRQTAGLVVSTLRAAANQATLFGTTTRVRFERGGDFVDGAIVPGRMHPGELAVVGTWTFEEQGLRGAFGLEGLAPGAHLADDGWLGRALSLRDPGVAGRLSLDPSAGFDEGFRVSVALRPDAGAALGGHVLDVGRVLGIDVEADGALRGWFAPELDDGAGRPGGAAAAAGGAHLFVRSEPGVAAPGRWSRVRLEYDRSRLSLVVDDRVVDVLDADAPVRAAARLEVALSQNDARGFRGDLDQLVLAAVASGGGIELPEQAVFVAPTPPELVFHAGGGLDPARHRGPEVIAIELADGTRLELRVGLQGTVDR